MRNGAISDQGRLLAAVSELDASPAPEMETAAARLAYVANRLVPGEFAMVCLGQDLKGIADPPQRIDGRRLDSPDALGIAGIRGRAHPIVASHDSTGLLVTGRPGDLRSVAPPPMYGHFWRPFGIEYMVGAPIGHSTGGARLAFPSELSYLASYRDGSGFSDEEIWLMDRLRPAAARLLRRASVSRLAETSMGTWGLGTREAEVFAFAGVGLSLPAIASILGLALGTVRTHLGKAYAKAGVRSRGAATAALLDVDPAALRDAGRRLVPGATSPLTRRERAVLRAAATGRTTAAIASVIGISTETTKTHLANAYRKLGVQNRSQALLLVGSARLAASPLERTVEAA
jgi:DNA-binding CsgD family transcriptional regulator